MGMNAPLHGKEPIHHQRINPDGFRPEEGEDIFVTLVIERAVPQPRGVAHIIRHGLYAWQPRLITIVPQESKAREGGGATIGAIDVRVALPCDVALELRDVLPESGCRTRRARWPQGSGLRKLRQPVQKHRIHPIPRQLARGIFCHEIFGHAIPHLKHGGSRIRSHGKSGDHGLRAHAAVQIQAQLRGGTGTGIDPGGPTPLWRAAGPARSLGHAIQSHCTLGFRTVLDLHEHGASGYHRPRPRGYQLIGNGGMVRAQQHHRP